MLIDKSAIERFSRQIILPRIGIAGQKRLGDSSVAIVGCGGLGCPSSLYLAAAGIGKLGLIDYDKVEISNIHRQILHNEDSIGIPKVNSMVSSLRKINSTSEYKPFNVALSPQNAVDLLSPYDVIVDASDNAQTRYLLNDTSVFLSKPLVSGSALCWEGQLTVYNHQNGPCYRCVFPVPLENAQNCSEKGVLGPVTGIIGSYQALEVIKIIVGEKPNFSGRLLLIDGLNGKTRTVNLRKKRDNCICNTKADPATIDYKTISGEFSPCGSPSLKILREDERVDAKELGQLVTRRDVEILDLRSRYQFETYNLPGSVNVPYEELENNKDLIIATSKHKRIVFVCMRGNNSQRAVIRAKEWGLTDACDLRGGIKEWAKMNGQSLAF